jgi:antitoxin component YwqK of YwqJK toxin-antitoxin module
MTLGRLFILVSFFISHSLWAQSSDPDSSGVVTHSLLPTNAPILLFKDPDETSKADKKKKKKKKKNVYFGEKTKKSYIKQSLRGQTQIQYFHYTLAKRTVDPYIRDVYWIDSKDKTIRNREFDPSKGYLLHGPYEKRIEDVLVESGMYFYGTKHGRWMKYDTKNILQDKTHFSEGWPKASRVSYYNRADKKIEKLTPIEYDLEEGNFYHFYEDGQVAVTGEYHYGEKVGLWTEYWNTKNNKIIRKREIQYQEEPFNKKFIPYIKAEWDNDGNLIYRKDG